jgi:hypothetical protein
MFSDILIFMKKNKPNKDSPKKSKFLKRKYILIGALALCIIAIITGIVASGRKEQPLVWYVEEGLESSWARILREAGRQPERSMPVQSWDGKTLPTEPGVLIAKQPWQKQEKASVYYRLSFDLEYQGAIVLALDPWMVFRKHTNPALTINRAWSDTGGSGFLLIPGNDAAAVNAWVGRLIQEGPGKFPAEEEVWREYEQKLFSGNRFPRGSRTYTWNDVFFRLMGNETTWVYAPLSAIRRYRDPRKAILEATPFPEAESAAQYSLQAQLLWALPIGADQKEIEKRLTPTIAWLKNPKTQTVIADTLEWIPADPYGEPYDPMSLASHRNWLTASYIYEIREPGE